MALRETLPVTYDRDTFESWEGLFGPSLSAIIESRLESLMKKYPARANKISIKFSGSIEGVTPEDVKERTARVTANAMVEGKQTLRGRILSTYRSIFNRRRGWHENRSKEQNICPVIICSVVIIPTEDAIKVDHE